MRWRSVCGRVAALCCLAGFDANLLHSAPAIGLQRDGSITIAGRSLRCGAVRNVLDPRLPNLGYAVPGRLVIFNPRLLNRHSDTVQLFVFHHECGHHHVGGSETAADCWATKQGVREGWLDSKGIDQVCRSFGNMPATPTHPSSASRCVALQRCFADVTAARPTVAANPQPPAPKLVSGPTLVRDNAKRPLR